MNKSKNCQIDYGSWVIEREQSSKSVVEFCKDKGIKPSVYYYWRKKSQKEQDKKFHHVKSKSVSFGEGIRIVYPNGVQVEIMEEMSTDQIRSLIGC